MERLQVTGIHVELQHYCNELQHFHPEMEILFVVAGELTVYLDKNRYHMERYDVLLINLNVAHHVITDENTVFCRVYISHKMLSELVKNGNYIFYCNSVGNKDMPYQEIRDIMKRIVLTFAGKPKKSECLRQGIVLELLDLLIENYQKDHSEQTGKKHHNSDEQLQYVINYVNMNYQEAIRLQDIAEELYTSTSTLSRFFRRQTGSYFSDFVNNVRMNYAKRDLRETDKTITKIAIDNGFSNPSVFSKLFQKTYNMSPTAFRKEQTITGQPQDQTAEWSAVQRTILEMDTGTVFEDQPENNVVSVQAGKGSAYRKFWGEVLNAGNAYNLTLANLQYHILFLSEQLKLPYVRIWNLFSRKMMIKKNKNDYNYNFNIIDNILDFMVNHKMKPFIDFGNRPDTALSGEGETIYYEEDYIELTTRQEWTHMFAAFMNHIIRRYGKEETESWIYEFSIDPRDALNLSEIRENISQIYMSCIAMIKKQLPQAKVGGLSAIVDKNMDELIYWIKSCKALGYQIDFASVLGFPYLSSVEGERETARRCADIGYINHLIAALRERLNWEGFTECELYITEWNISLSNRNYLNDSCFRASNLIQTVSDLWGLPDVLGVWMGSDWISSYYDTSQVANGGSGLLTKDGIRKPVFYALSFLNSLGSGFLQKGDHYIATTNDGQSFYILCYNCKAYSPAFFLKEENDLKPGSLDELFENNSALTLDISLDNMPENVTYVVKQHSMDQKHGSILGQWEKFQYEQDMEGSDVKYLRDTCVPALQMEKITVKDGRLPIHVKLESQAFILIQIYEAN